MSARPRRSSAAQLSRHNDPAFAIQNGNITSSDSRPRPVSFALSASSIAALSQTSGSLTRTPARSFVHRASVSGGDRVLSQYSSHGVREQTAELASWALADTSSLQSGSPPTRRPFTADSPSRTSAYFTAPEHSNPNKQRHRDSVDSAYIPEVIQEVSEPVSPIVQVSAGAAEEEEEEEENDDMGLLSSSSALTNMIRKSRSNLRLKGDHEEQKPIETEGHESDAPKVTLDQTDGPSDERTPLLSKPSQAADDSLAKNRAHDVEEQASRVKKQTKFRQLLNEAQENAAGAWQAVTSPKSWDRKIIFQKVIKDPVGLLPCVFLGILLNVLDALSYGMILFPLGEPIFAKTGPDGISMFYISCIVSQLVFSCGGSIFKGAVGSEMIEVVPFFHTMAYSIMARTGTENPKVVLATTITAFAMSSVLTGIVFFILGAFKLGSLVNFFPRHILIGCIGGVGFFLFVTGIEVSARLDGNLNYSLATLEQLFRLVTFPLWIIPFVLSILLLVLKRFTSSPYLVPAFFIAIAGIFYIVAVAAPQLDLDLLRRNGWIFDSVDAGVPFYNFYSYYDFRAVDWSALASCIPAMFALTFFGILHVPINVPALAIAAEEDDLNLNRELVAHGLSNALSGLCGSIQNYLVYVNSEMFISNGGNSRLAGILLAAATFGVLIAGPGMIGFVPVMVVGALIFYLGIALLEEALWDTWGKMSRLEYLTVLAIVLTMGIYDFVAGILAGIVLACLSFVVQTSRKSSIRATYSGQIVESTVRRHPIQRHFLHEVGYQIYVTKLTGFLFFGSIVQVEKGSRALIEEENFRAEPIRYLIFDLANVRGMDFSAAEAFTRLERILGRRDVKMIFSGIKKDDEQGRSLRNVGLWNDDSSVEFFETLNNALEFCENELLSTFYQERDAMSDASSSPRQSLDISKIEDQKAHLSPNATNPLTMLPSSPRANHLHTAAASTLTTHRANLPSSSTFQSPHHPASTHHHHPHTSSTSNLKQPLPLLLSAFAAHSPHGPDFWHRALPYFHPATHPAGTTLFTRSTPATAFYLLSSGILRADYMMPAGGFSESIVAGTTCGELPFFSGTERTATVVAETEVKVWVLDGEAWARMQEEWGEGARELLKVALGLTKERVDAVVGYVLTSAG